MDNLKCDEELMEDRLVDTINSYNVYQSMERGSDYQKIKIIKSTDHYLIYRKNYFAYLFIIKIESNGKLKVKLDESVVAQNLQHCINASGLQWKELRPAGLNDATFLSSLRKMIVELDNIEELNLILSAFDKYI